MRMWVVGFKDFERAIFAAVNAKSTHLQFYARRRDFVKVIYSAIRCEPLKLITLSEGKIYRALTA